MRLSEGVAGEPREERVTIGKRHSHITCTWPDAVD